MLLYHQKRVIHTCTSCTLGMYCVPSACTAEALSEKDLWDDLLKTSEDFLKEQVEVKREHDLEALGICGNCQIQKVHCKDCNESHCAEEGCDCFDDFIYKCGVCEESLCEFLFYILPTFTQV